MSKGQARKLVAGLTRGEAVDWLYELTGKLASGQGVRALLVKALMNKG